MTGNENRRIGGSCAVDVSSTPLRSARPQAVCPLDRAANASLSVARVPGVQHWERWNGRLVTAGEQPALSGTRHSSVDGLEDGSLQHRWYLRARESPYALRHVSPKFPPEVPLKTFLKPVSCWG